MFERPYCQQLVGRLKEPRAFIQVVMGPRQVGKSTMVEQALGRLAIPFHLVSADATANAGSAWLEQQWETARLRWSSSGGGDFILAVDEVQKIANWSEQTKKFWDEDTRAKRPIKVVLLGSSRLLLQQGLTESLAGRFDVRMPHASRAGRHTPHAGQVKYGSQNSAVSARPRVSPRSRMAPARRTRHRR